MEHKPIYLDGVDVSECLFYQINFEEDHDVRIKHFCSNWHNSCESINNSNCYFKQLARKTHECEIWKNQVLILDEEDVTVEVTQEQFEEYQKLRQQCKQLKEDYAELERECERLKSYGATLLADKNAMEIGRDDYLQRCKRLEQECEELKEENQQLRNSLSDSLMFKFTGQENETNRYRKALEEIEQIVNEPCVADAQEDCKHCDFWCEHKEILNIINKARGGNNENT